MVEYQQENSYDTSQVPNFVQGDEQTCGEGTPRELRCFRLTGKTPRQLQDWPLLLPLLPLLLRVMSDRWYMHEWLQPSHLWNLELLSERESQQLFEELEYDWFKAVLGDPYPPKHKGKIKIKGFEPFRKWQATNKHSFAEQKNEWYNDAELLNVAANLRRKWW